MIDLSFVFVFSGVPFLYSAKLASSCCSTWPLYVFIGAVLRPALRRKVKQKFRRWASGQQLLVESLIGMQTLKAAAVEPMFQRKWEERLSAFVKVGFEAAMLGARVQNATEFMTN